NRELGDTFQALMISSLKPEQGETLLAVNLAYAYSISGKKVLMIDGNFNNPSISEMVNPGYFLEELFANKNPNIDFFSGDSIKVLGNQGEDVSLFEISEVTEIARKFQYLKSKFDRIIIETADLETM